MPVTKKWTVMFFFASDNPLAPGTISQLKAIKNAGYHPEANVIAHFDPHTVNMPVHVFDVNLVEKLKHEGKSNIGYAKRASFVRNLVLDKLWDKDTKQKIKETKGPKNYDPPVPGASMSEEQTPKRSLKDFLEFCRLEYPAHHYMLFIIGHGIVVGNDLFMLDEHGPASVNGTAGTVTTEVKGLGKTATEKDDSPQQTLRLKDLSEVLGGFKDKIKIDKGQFELMGFHSCSMSGVEVALQLKDTANYMLASQGPSYVGSWPYRQILIRLFTDLDELPELPTDGYPIVCSLIDKLKTSEDPVSTYLRDSLNGNGQRLLQTNSIEDEREFVRHLVTNLRDRDLSGVTSLQEKLPEKTQKLLTRHLSEPFSDEDRARLNLLMLESHYGEEMPKVRIREMLTKIFHYYMYNSFDFQLAGYSSDLTLCDLTKVHHIQEPLNKLAAALIKGLDYARQNNKPLIREAILLAHWEAQSFYEEKYTDLYDFCFRLSSRFKPAEPARDTTQPTREATPATEEDAITEIFQTCDAVMKVLRRGATDNDYGPIVRSEFSGAEYQYSHGLSIFFPWSEPAGNLMWKFEYADYVLNAEKGTCWKDFLHKYFKETMRKTQEEEKDLRETGPQRSSLDQDLLEILQKIAARATSDDGVLKAGPKDPLGPGKAGAKDPTGSDCECDTIKNYPSFTRALASPDLIMRVASQLDEDDQPVSPVVPVV